MLKYLLKRTVYREFNTESQEMLYYLTAKRYVVRWFCHLFWVVIYILPFVPFFIVGIRESMDISMSTKIAIVLWFGVWDCVFIALIVLFRDAMFAFLEQLAVRMCFMICTKKGKAIRKEDFNTIRRADSKLYACIARQLCRGYCFSICFGICKALKKGSIEILAVKNFLPNDSASDEKKKYEKYALHALYVNNNWAFNTFSSCQYPLEELHRVCEAIVYKTYDHKEIQGMSYQEFKEIMEDGLEEWTSANDCTMYVEDT